MHVEAKLTSIEDTIFFNICQAVCIKMIKYINALIVALQLRIGDDLH
jgi:hypothetical protein